MVSRLIISKIKLEWVDKIFIIQKLSISVIYQFFKDFFNIYWKIYWMIVIAVELRVLFMYRNDFCSFKDWWKYTHRKRDVTDVRKMRYNFILKQFKNIGRYAIWTNTHFWIQARIDAWNCFGYFLFFIPVFVKICSWFSM